MGRVISQSLGRVKGEKSLGGRETRWRPDWPLELPSNGPSYRLHQPNSDLSAADALSAFYCPSSSRGLTRRYRSPKYGRLVTHIAITCRPRDCRLNCEVVPRMPTVAELPR